MWPSSLSLARGISGGLSSLSSLRGSSGGSLSLAVAGDIAGEWGDLAGRDQGRGVCCLFVVVL